MTGERVLVTGAAGFIGGYLCTELLEQGYEVVAVDNFSKYGTCVRDYEIVKGDCRDTALMTQLLYGCDHLVAGAAKIGGIRYFHEFPYSLLAENERIMAATCDAAIKAYQRGTLQKVTYISSSMVYEGTTAWPSREGDERLMPPPLSSYGFQKLAVEYFARAAWDEHQLPYTIVRPFNCVGVGESAYMAHVVPDLIRKLLSDKPSLSIRGGKQVRHYTYGKDLARGIRLAMESPDALGEDFNMSTAESTTVWQLATILWQKIRGPAAPWIVSDMEPLPYDVRCRIPDVTKAEKILGFTAETSLSDMLDVVIDHIRSEEDGYQDSMAQ